MDNMGRKRMTAMIKHLDLFVIAIGFLLCNWQGFLACMILYFLAGRLICSLANLITLKREDYL